MSQGFKVGDVVRLKSGGPAMTVIQISGAADDKPFVLCSWFSEPVKKQGTFPPDAVSPATPADKETPYES